MARFVLTAQLQLQAPSNTRAVVTQIRKQLAGQTVKVPVEVKGAKQAEKAVKDVTREVTKANSAAQALGKSFGIAIKRFAAFTVASRAVSLFTNTLANAVDEAIDFQREVVKIAQVTGTSVKELRSLQNTITSLSTSLGVVSKDLLQVTRILSQAGVRGSELEVALSSLAKSTLAPTFDDITQTAEGAVAIIRQFKEGTAALEGQLGSINAVAGQFAVESGDLIAAVRRFGGVFKTAGGSLEELLALFTSVRATTRESGESIATGLRTIFTRIQRPATIQYLRELGVELQNAEGKFIGPFEAAKKLGEAFATLPQGDPQFVQIAEELGGFRQIGKVIPLIQQYETAQEALNVAQQGQNSLSKDAATAQQALAVQITKVKEEFLALVRGIADSTSFQVFTRTALNLASALIKIADAVKPLIPLLGALAAFKFTQGLGSFIAGAGGAIKGAAGGIQARNSGGKILKFNRGGYVPGSGNGDTVPAMLEPGEFVIRKSSVKKLGGATLEAMNNNKFAAGGAVKVRAVNNEAFGAFTILDEGEIAKDGKKLAVPAANALRPRVDKLIQKSKTKPTAAGKVNTLKPADLYRANTIGTTFSPVGKFGKFVKRRQIDKKALRDEKTRKRAEEAFAKEQRREVETTEKKNLAQVRQTSQDNNYPIRLQGPFKARQIGGPPADLEKGFAKEIKEAANASLDSGVKRISKSRLVRDLDLAPIDTKEGKLFDFKKFKEGAGESVEGYLLEGITGALTNAEIGGGGTNFDFPNVARAKVQKERLKKLYPGDERFIDKLLAADAKRQKSTADNGDGALYNKIAKDSRLKIALANKGGSISGDTDTVPALLTPGEFVVNKKAAQKIGYSNLNTMNKKGVSRFAKGGAVGVQKFGIGGVVSGGGGLNFLAIQGALGLVTSLLDKFADTSKDATDKQFKYGTIVKSTGQALLQLAIIGTVVKGLKSGIKDWANATADGTRAVKENAQAQGEAEKAAKSEDSKKSETSKKSDVNIKDEAEKSRAKKPKQVKTGTDRASAAIVRATEQQTKAEEKLNKVKKTQAKDARAKTKIDQKLVKLAVRQKAAQDKLATAQDLSSKESADLAKKIGRIKTEIDTQERALLKQEKTLEKSTRAVKKQEAAFQKATVKRLQAETKLNGALNTTKTAALGVVNAYRKKTTAMVKASGATGKVRTGLVKLRASWKSTGAAIATFRGELGKLRAQAKKGLGVGGGGRKAVGKAASTAVGIGGGLVGIAAVVQQITASVQAFAKRAEDQQRDQGNVTGSAQAAEAGVIAGAVGEAFSISGIAEILFSGTGSFAERIIKQAKIAGARSATETAVSNISEVNKGLLDESAGGKFRGSGGELEAGKATRELAKSANAARAKINNLPDGKERRKLTNEVNAGLRESIQTLVSQDVSLAQAEQSARALAGGNKKLEEEFLRTARSAVNLREAQKQLAEANIQSLKITSAFGAANAAVDAFSQGLVTGGSSLDGYITQLESARKNVGVDASPAIDALEKSLVDQATAVGAGGLGKAISGQADVARASIGFSKNVGGAVSGLKLSRNNPEVARSELKAALAGAIPDDAGPEVREQLRKVIASNVDAIDGKDIATTDISELVKKVAEGGQQLSNGFFEAAKLQSQHNARMSTLYQEREALEVAAAQALNAAIEEQLDAAKQFESFGGARLTGDQKLSARIAQFNNIGGLAGAGLQTGSADDIRNVAAGLSNQFFAQQNAVVGDIANRAVAGDGRAGIFSGPQGVTDDKRNETKEANKALLAFTKQRITLLKEEISIVQKKNQEEKNSLEKLISGDIEGFIKGQQAAGAGAALRTGSQGLTSLFSASALGAGFKSLEGQGLSDEQKSRAESLTLSRFGLQGNGVLSGTDAESEALKAEGRELAQLQGQLAGQGAQFEKSEIAINEATIVATNATFARALSETSSNNEAQGLWRGGTVYASKGMFVPRGTDTVPAMLTPGEFVVNRSAVKRGNNLQLLRAMNTGGGASGPGHKSGGGQVQYYQFGGLVDSITNALTGGTSGLAGVFSGFSASVDKLIASEFKVKLDTTNVNVNFNGLSALDGLKGEIKKEIMGLVVKKLESYKPDSSGDLKETRSVLGT